MNVILSVITMGLLLVIILSGVIKPLGVFINQHLAISQIVIVGVSILYAICFRINTNSNDTVEILVRFILCDLLSQCFIFTWRE